MNELVFEVVEESDGGYVAECLTCGIFTQGDTWEELRRNVEDAVAGFFFDQPKTESFDPWRTIRRSPGRRSCASFDGL